MRKLVLFFLLTLSLAAVAQDSPSLTIYNGGFAAVRERVPMELKAGINPFTFAGATSTLEPESLILRDPEGKRSLQILEQSYRNDPVTQGLLLSLYEGKTIEFITGRTAEGKDITVWGKIVRSGYLPPSAQNQYGGAQQPVIEVDGKLRFSMPGEPIFPDLGQGTILKPTLNWLLQTDKAGAFNAELAYITNGMSWNADYNLVIPETGNTADVVGWITMHNNSGKTFENARIRLMAGDVNKIQNNVRDMRVAAKAIALEASNAAAAPVVTEKAFDEFHLYTLEHPTTLHEEETKQVEFVHAMNVHSERIYVYDGMQGYYYYGSYVGDQPGYGSQSNKKVWVMQEFKNSKENGLGIALPKGRLRFYRRDSDGSLQFVGENEIDHTPKDETVRVYTGNTFDVVGERKQTDYHVDRNGHTADETFEIKVRNHKKESVNVRVVEHMYRWNNWKIVNETDDHVKTDSQTVEFRVNVAPDQEKIVKYVVHYWW